MSFAVNNLASSLAATGQSSRVQSKENRKAERHRETARPADEFQPATQTEHAEAVRNLKDNSHEEAHEDRQQHAGDFEGPELHGHGGDAPANPVLARTAYDTNARRRPPRLDLDA